MTQITPKGVIRWPGLRKRFDDDISRSTIDRWIKAGKFPPKIQLGMNSIGWSVEAVDQWFQELSDSVLERE